jgi:hypothetical protein
MAGWLAGLLAGGLPGPSRPEFRVWTDIHSYDRLATISCPYIYMRGVGVCVLEAETEVAMQSHWLGLGPVFSSNPVFLVCVLRRLRMKRASSRAGLRVCGGGGM